MTSFFERAFEKFRAIKRRPKPHVHVCRRCGFLLRGCLCDRPKTPGIPEERGCVRCDSNVVDDALKDSILEIPHGQTVPFDVLLRKTGIPTARLDRAIRFRLYGEVRSESPNLSRHTARRRR